MAERLLLLCQDVLCLSFIHIFSGMVIEYQEYFLIIPITCLIGIVSCNIILRLIK